MTRIFTKMAQTLKKARIKLGSIFAILLILVMIRSGESSESVSESGKVGVNPKNGSSTPVPEPPNVSGNGNNDHYSSERLANESTDVGYNSTVAPEFLQFGNLTTNSTPNTPGPFKDVQFLNAKSRSECFTDFFKDIYR